MIGLVDDEGFLGHIYYGPRIPDDNMAYLMRAQEWPRLPCQNQGTRASFFDFFPWEYPAWGGGDFRQSCLRVKAANGAVNSTLTYCGHRIFSGKPALAGLPAAFPGETDCETLELVCQDKISGLKVFQYYSVFTDVDAICRSVRVENSGDEPLELTTILSACLDSDNLDFDLITLHGTWGGEQQIDRRSLGPGRHAVFSERGISSHQYHPFLALAEHTATQEHGFVYGMSFLYSGSFLAQAELDQFDHVRAAIGIQPEGFCWCLEPGESFQAPEAVLVCSNAGIGGMSRTFHDFFRQHLIRGQNKHRPPLVNSWEGVYFDFNMERLLQLGREAADSGIELLVLDDGWFGRRNDDKTSLGDWVVNEEKLPGGLKRLGEELVRMRSAVRICPAAPKIL